MFVQFAATIFLVPVAIHLVSAAPVVKTVQLHPFGQLGKCLDLQGNIRSGGQPVQVYDCNGSSAQNWEISDGPTVVKLAGTNYCLDSGDTVADGNRIEVKTCKAGKASQQWNYTDDKHIENQGESTHFITSDLTQFNKGQCVDSVKGNNQNGNRVQSWKCSRPSQHQVWSTARTST
ncbi:carbohydrate-binding module family 13 protein [Pleurotus ostreatus PC15]|uniref:Carbohydrate-binding module family 13 protein n=1 Tax=Pleurotus ostreatus (strain PC15) TaxID=1137138 RepID=A0A067NX25_PLEO1|nr:carbohydrate-binding module family 13 protein [Pleurotus ostreatus PC15]